MRSYLENEPRGLSSLPMPSLSPMAQIALAQLVALFLHAQALRHGSANREEARAYSLDWIDGSTSKPTPKPAPLQKGKSRRPMLGIATLPAWRKQSSWLSATAGPDVKAAPPVSATGGGRSSGSKRSVSHSTSGTRCG